MTDQTIEPLAEDETGNEDHGLTRRQVLVAATAGGAALAATALGGAAIGSLATRAEGMAAQAGSELELTKLRTLVGLYENLERVGIDAVIQTGVNVMRGAMEAVRTGTRLVRDGITATERALQALRQMVDTLHSAADRATQGLADLMTKFHAAESVVIAVLGTALPLTESITGFFKSLVDKIPFGIGDNIKRAIDALVALIRAIPPTVEDITSQLLKPLTDNFFPAGGAAPVQTRVVDPITANLLEPLSAFLGDVDKLMSAWEKDFTGPVQAALSDRQKIRDQIAIYRKENKV